MSVYCKNCQQHSGSGNCSLGAGGNLEYTYLHGSGGSHIVVSRDDPGIVRLAVEFGYGFERDPVGRKTRCQEEAVFGVAKPIADRALSWGKSLMQLASGTLVH